MNADHAGIVGFRRRHRPRRRGVVPGAPRRRRRRVGEPAGHPGRPRRQPGQGLVRRLADQAGAAWRWAARTLLERLTPEFLRVSRDVRAGRREDQAEHACSASRWCLRVAVRHADGAAGEHLRGAGDGHDRVHPAVHLAVVEAERAAEEVRRRSCRTRWNWWPAPCVPATRWPPACTWWPRKCPSRSPRSSAGSTRSRTWASAWKTR